MADTLDHIPLDRVFRELRPDSNQEQNALDSYIGEWGNHRWATHDWTKLLSHKGIVVVLGEPGCGKTWEFQWVVKQERAAGRIAFFLPLERLVREPVEAILQPEEGGVLEQWKRGAGQALFLLDSVDEAKLDRVADFYTALDRLAASISGRVDRANIILSSRISEWCPNTDRLEVAKRLVVANPKSSPAIKADGKVVVVEMVPLDSHRIGVLASAKSDGRAQHFLDEIERRHAWELAGRPLDVMLLLDFWNQHDRLGTLTETLEYLVTEHLRERVESCGPLLSLCEAAKAGTPFFCALSPQEAELACIYATNEMNGLPEWLYTLAIHHPASVSAVLTQSIALEWGSPERKGTFPNVLQTLSQKECPLAGLMAPAILEQMRKCDPGEPFLLDCALSVLTRSSVLTRPEWAVLASNKVAQLGFGAPRLSQWLRLWLDADPTAALQYAEQVLSPAMQTGDVADNFVASLAGNFGELAPRLTQSDLLKLPHLLRWLRLVIQWVLHTGYITRESGEVYEMGSRDSAERYCDTLLTILANMPGEEAEIALRGLLSDTVFQGIRANIQYLLDKRLSSHADGQPWTPASVREFAERNEKNPTSSYDLFNLVCRRLQTIREAVETPDSASLRRSVQPGNDEAELRAFIASELIRRSHELYGIVEERLIDRDERPDLTVSRPGVVGTVAIEAKLADKGWTLKTLLERLEVQLVGQYLRAREERYGVFLVGYVGDKSHWEDGDGKRLSFEDLIGRLEARAQELVVQTPGVKGLKVVGIDFRTPPKPSR